RAPEGRAHRRADPGNVRQGLPRRREDRLRHRHRREPARRQRARVPADGRGRHAGGGGTAGGDRARGRGAGRGRPGRDRARQARRHHRHARRPGGRHQRGARGGLRDEGRQGVQVRTGWRGARNMEWTGYAAATLTTLAFGREAVKPIRTRDTRSLSLGMYVVFTIGIGCWFLYGIVLDSWPMIAANAITFVSSSVILGRKPKHGGTAMNTKPHVCAATAANFQSDLLQGSLQAPVLVDFWATGCGPCKTLGPILEKLAAEYNGAFRLAKVDVDVEQQLAGAFQIRSVPTVILVKDGQPVDGF